MSTRWLSRAARSAPSLCLWGFVLVASSVIPTARAQTPDPVASSAPAVVAERETVMAMATPSSPETMNEPTRVIRITSQVPTSRVTVREITNTPAVPVTPTLTLEPIATVSGDAEPIIFTGIEIDQRCGHGDVVAADGHVLRATPRLPVSNSNFLEQLPLGTRVDLIDCRLWVDQEDLNWLAVRTPEKKLGWMLVQPDKFYVTLYPVHLDVPKALTGIPAGSTIAYVPPSACNRGPVSNEAMATSIGVDFVPIVGDVKGVVEAATGCDMVTGESLGTWRWLGLLGLIGLGEVALLRHGDEAVDGARMVDNLRGSLRYSDESVMAAVRHADDTADLARQVGKIGRDVDKSSDVARSLDGGHVLSDDALRALAKFEQPCSFSAETSVSTSNGLVPISSIKPGEMVLAHSEILGKTGYYTVTAAFAHVDTDILTLTIGQEVLETTPAHPFYVGGDWVPAADLAVGDAVASAAGETAVIHRIVRSTRTEMMYNLTVAEAHTYFVGSGKYLVHNACSRILRNRLSTPTWGSDGRWQAHHIIPGQWEDHPFVVRAKKGGWDIDGAQNGIALPVSDADAKRLGLTKHLGSHPGYSGTVERELDVLEQSAFRNEWDNQRAATELTKLADRLRRQVGG